MSTRQLAMVMDLNKCIGCQTCTVACKTQWTNRNGREYMYWNNVETRPGTGFPRNWEGMGGGFDGSGTLREGTVPSLSADYGTPWDFNLDEAALGKVIGPIGEPRTGPNWDEDRGEGDFPNSWFFYLPRICNHCSNPGCLAACPRGAIFKRDQDGVVLVDQERCEGLRYCIAGCPYKKVYFNTRTFRFGEVHPLLPAGGERARASLRAAVRRAAALRGVPGRRGGAGPQARPRVAGGAPAPPRVRHAGQRVLRAAAPRASEVRRPGAGHPGQRAHSHGVPRGALRPRGAQGRVEAGVGDRPPTGGEALELLDVLIAFKQEEMFRLGTPTGPGLVQLGRRGIRSVDAPGGK